jgi:acyl dehydratase
MKTALKFHLLEVGDELPPLVLPPVSRLTLALFAGASGDHNAVHVDTDAARASGMPDVFAQGMLGMAWLGRLLTDWAPQHMLKSFQSRFTGITHLGNVIQCSGRIVEKFELNGENCVRIEVSCSNQYGQVKIFGSAVVAFS